MQFTFHLVYNEYPFGDYQIIQGTSIMKILLNVPYPEKDTAKARGAKWDPTVKSWYISAARDIPNLLRWLPEHNIVCENLYLLKMQQRCWRCGGNTEVILLATDKSYSSEDNYQADSNIQILTYVKTMPDPLKEYLQHSWRYFPSFSKAIRETCFVNHCTECGSIQGDNYLHEVPERAFYKKLFYQNADPIRYAVIRNQFAVLIKANLPYYDEISRSLELMMAHMETGIENRASLMVTQAKINHLFDPNVSIRDDDIVIPGL